MNNKIEGMFDSDRCSWCNDFGSKSNPYICINCQEKLDQYADLAKEEVRNKITTGHIEGHCAWFHIDNQTFLLLENYQDEHITSEDAANWILKCLNTAFDKLRDSKE